MSEKKQATRRSQLRSLAVESRLLSDNFLRVFDDIRPVLLVHVVVRAEKLLRRLGKRRSIRHRPIAETRHVLLDVELLVVVVVNFRPLFVELSRVLASVLAVLLLELGVLLLLCLRLPS